MDKNHLKSFTIVPYRGPLLEKFSEKRVMVPYRGPLVVPYSGPLVVPYNGPPLYCHSVYLRTFGILGSVPPRRHLWSPESTTPPLTRILRAINHLELGLKGCIIFQRLKI